MVDGIKTREDYLAYARRGLRNRGVEPTVKNMVKFFAHQRPEERARILTEMPPEDVVNSGGPETRDTEELLERHRTVSEMNKIHHALLRQRR